MTEVATTMRTRFEIGGTAPEPADILKSNNGRYQQWLNAVPVRRAVLISQNPDSMPDL
jgi:hypothetical protein